MFSIEIILIKQSSDSILGVIHKYSLVFNTLDSILSQVFPEFFENKILNKLAFNPLASHLIVIGSPDSISSPPLGWLILILFELFFEISF